MRSGIVEIWKCSNLNCRREVHRTLTASVPDRCSCGAKLRREYKTPAFRAVEDRAEVRKLKELFSATKRA